MTHPQQHMEPHPQHWQQPGPGHILPQHPYAVPGAPKPPERATGGRTAMFVIATSLSGISLLLGLSSIGSGRTTPIDAVMPIFLLVAAGLTAFFIYRAVKSKFRYLWSILLLVVNVAVPLLVLGGTFLFLLLTLIIGWNAP